MHAINNNRYGALRQLVSAALGVLAFGLGVAGSVFAASGTPTAPVSPVAIIGVDDDARGISYPTVVFFDPTEEEIYLINGGTSRVVVYGPDFFPRMSIGKGRGVAYPRGVYVTSSGHVYVSQAVNRANPVRRITILNGAFFVEREIFLDEIPEAAGLSPGPLAVSRDGTIYLTSDKVRGVLVLDKDGNFLRWLKPMDMISDRKALAAEAAKKAADAQAPAGLEQAPIEVESEEPPPEDLSSADIPEEFRPKSEEEEAGDPAGPGLGPVRIHNVAIDSVGNIYLLSSETSKVYVYGPDESFLFSFGKKGGTPRSMSQPRGLAIDEKNDVIYIVDYSRHTVIAYDMAGEFLFEIGGRGFKPGFFNFPVSIAVNRHGQVIISDLFNKRVQVLDVDYKGRFQIIDEEPPAEAGAEGEEGAGENAEGEAPEDSAESAAESEESAVEEVMLPAEAISTPTESGPEAADEPGSAGGTEGRAPAASTATDGAAVEDATKPEKK